MPCLQYLDRFDCLRGWNGETDGVSDTSKQWRRKEVLTYDSGVAYGKSCTMVRNDGAVRGAMEALR